MLKISPKTSKWGIKSGLKMGPKKTILAPLKDLTTSPKTRDLGRFCMLKMLPKRKKSAPKRRIGAKNRGQDANEKDKNVRIEKPILPKNEGQNTWI